jgi:hypothetical protein
VSPKLPFCAAGLCHSKKYSSATPAGLAAVKKNHALWLSGEDIDDNQVEILAADDDSSVEKAGFDGEGFANYLGPYVLAFVAAIALTAGFVKFVLMDY